MVHLLPQRIPSEAAVTTTLSQGRVYRVKAGAGKVITVHLLSVTLTKPGQEPIAMSEASVGHLLVLARLVKKGETYIHSDNAHLTEQETDARPDAAFICVSPRAARVLCRVLAVRARLRTDLVEAQA